MENDARSALRRASVATVALVRIPLGRTMDILRKGLNLTNISGGGDRLQGYAVREQLPLPSKPPYTAHLGNLSFDATEGDVQDFFAACQVNSVRIIEDKMERKPKGFGYVEFGSLDGLKKALDLSGTQFQGRNIRVTVADPRELYSVTSTTTKLTTIKPRTVLKVAKSPTGLAKAH